MAADLFAAVDMDFDSAVAVDVVAVVDVEAGFLLHRQV